MFRLFQAERNKINNHGKYMALYCLYLVVLECKMMRERKKREHKQLCAQNEAASLALSFLCAFCRVISH